MNVYFTADLHLESPGILHTPRGKFFETVEAHDDAILENIISTVANKDVDRLYVLGDIGSKRGIEKFVNAVDKYDVRVVLGNHDQGSKSIQYFRHNFTEAEHLLQYKYANGRIVMTHYPCMCWDMSYYGSINLFGHCHANINNYLRRFRDRARMLDVGVDSAQELLGAHRPFSLEEVFKLTDKPGHSPDANRLVIHKILLCYESIVGFHRYSYDILFEYDFNKDYLPKQSTIMYLDDECVLLNKIDRDNLRMTVLVNVPLHEGDSLIWE